ncbi:uncharacterized protein L3040_003054 [Drepanopeziza brunnea f. sp. 'multigermtubi']|uniref:RING finger domain protein n=1 Tax=Marssonina brunnea f. sp. multigermtubi (strain MB_m1) TaxID=1072389 RepID=K1XLC7_MARBU|nr:RING finger domain protein [Drepanopeziza brunnea f. sp. 'multigermtubi' MB_m1]EKD13254.1 RING finger domain protein [Drepanopeziza brunnea f. sp. 'multigermtubi' MB_m1]KAJ5047213.1 hypothetical protein L3040_003054 [Drepanopeziza brunnea f. sp. 'multigermtubi']
MASLPSQAARRRSSPEQRPSSPAQEISSHEPDTSESQWTPLNTPGGTAEASISTTTSPITSSVPEPAKPQRKEDARICWICQSEETEDTPEDGPWRNPCSCSLTAHEHCLLEWVADQEAPKPQILAAPRLHCPQCKDPIKVERPRNPIVEAFSLVEKLARGLVLPSAISGVMGCAYSGLMIYGVNTTFLVFGAEDAWRLLGAPTGGRASPGTWRSVVNLFNTMDPFFPTPQVEASMKVKLWLSLPLIGPALVFLRTGLADQASALLLPIYFLNNLNRNPNWKISVSWPPTPGLTFAAIPFIKKAYNSLYHYAFSALERDWDRAVRRKPREGETAEEIEEQAVADEDEGRAILDVQWVEEEDMIDPAAARNAAPERRREVRHRWVHHQEVSAAKVMTTVMGALFFPAVSSAMGEVLKAILPVRWVGYNRCGGLLREKWARTVVGGCIFVVLKDVVTLYVKWQRAKNAGKRKVLEYVGRKGIRGR